MASCVNHGDAICDKGNERTVLTFTKYYKLAMLFTVSDNSSGVTSLGKEDFSSPCCNEL